MRGVHAIGQFFKDISSPGDVENVKEYTTPKFFQYLASEFDHSGTYRPVYKVNIDKIPGVRWTDPAVLLGNPKIFEYVESHRYIHDPLVSPYAVFREPSKFGPPEPFKYVEIFQVRKEIALASGWPFSVADPWPFWPQLLGYLWGYKLLQNVRPWYREQVEQGSLKGMSAWEVAGAFLKEMTLRTELPGRDGSLAHTFVIKLEAPVAMSLVDRAGGEEKTVFEGREK